MNNSSRPIIKIELSSVDYTMEAIALLAILFSFVYPFIFYKQLPSQVPIHFNLEGDPDSFARKISIWFFPLLSLVHFIAFTWLNTKPHIFNYKQKITQENALRQYKIATRMMRGVKVCIVVMFAYVTYSIINIGMGNQDSLYGWIILLLIGLLVAVVFYGLWKASKSG